jgi:hypothetical protein
VYTGLRKNPAKAGISVALGVAEGVKMGQRYWVTRLQRLDEEVRYLEAQPERHTVEVGHQKSIPIVSDHKSMPIAGRWFPALGIRHKSRDSSYLSCFT